MNTTADSAQTRNRRRTPALGPIATVLACLVLLAGAGLLLLWIFSSEPKAERATATKRTAALVSVETVSPGRHTPQIRGLGRVEAAQDIQFSARVGGLITDMAETFVPGGFVAEGERLITIDPADYENIVAQRQSALRSAQSQLELELGRRDVAREDFQFLDENLREEYSDLFLREPQLNAALAEVESAEAALNQAKLDLERTRVTAPFNAQVLSRQASIGSNITAGQPLARLVGVDEYWVIATLPVAKLDQVRLADEHGEGARVELRDRAGWPEGVVRTGRAVRLIGALDDGTRLARVLVTVKDPLARGRETEGPKLILGSILQATIEGRPLDNVVRINRDYLRQGDRVWVMADGALDIREADVAFRDGQFAYLKGGLEAGDKLVTSRLATVAEGLPLRTEGEEAPLAATSSPSTGGTR